MERTKAIFDWIFSLESSEYQLDYLASPNVALGQDAIRARMEKERTSLQSVQSFATTYLSLKQVWAFLNEQHALYAANKLIKRGRDDSHSDASVLVRKSYGAN